MEEVTIRDVYPHEKEMIQKIVEIHLETFTGFFLTFMGRGFLRQLYLGYCAHPSSGLLAAVDSQDTPVGFLGYSRDYSDLYRYLIKKRLFVFAWYSMGAFLRKPKIFMRLIRAFLKPGESKGEENYVELASIGVSPRSKSGGIGSRLISELKKRVDFTAYPYIKLETDAENNEPVNRFYQKNGFVLYRTYTTPEGRRMNEYRYSQKSLLREKVG